MRGLLGPDGFAVDRGVGRAAADGEVVGLDDRPAPVDPALPDDRVRGAEGGQLAVVAADADAGLTLLSALRRRPGSPLTVSLPDANAEATRALRAWGMRPINAATRMRLGPAPAYDPARVFGMFNLFWG